MVIYKVILHVTNTSTVSTLRITYLKSRDCKWPGFHKEIEWFTYREKEQRKKVNISGRWAVSCSEHTLSFHPRSHLTGGSSRPLCSPILGTQFRRSPCLRVVVTDTPRLPRLPLAHHNRLSLMSDVCWSPAWPLPVALRFIISLIRAACAEKTHPLYVLKDKAQLTLPVTLADRERKTMHTERHIVTGAARGWHVRVVILFSSPLYSSICGGNRSSQWRQLTHITNLLTFAWHNNCLSGPSLAPLSAGLLTCVLKIAEWFIDFIIMPCVWLVQFISMCQLILCSLKCNKTKSYLSSERRESLGEEGEFWLPLSWAPYAGCYVKNAAGETCFTKSLWFDEEGEEQGLISRILSAESSARERGD